MSEITVAITTHNLENHITNCLNELLHQTFDDFDILIYDDFSTDATREMLEQYRTKYPDKIHVILGEKPLGSPARSRNAVLDSQQITGRYLVFLDGDDNIELNYLERLYMTAVQTNAEITLCAYDRFENETGHVLCQEMRGFPKEITFPVKDDVLAFVNGSLWNKLIKTSIIGENRIPDFKVGEDISFQLALYEKCHKIACVDEILIHYRVRQGSVISNTQEQSIYEFANELGRLFRQTNHSWYKDVIAMIAFIHIGISMTFRAYDNPNVDEKKVIQWVDKYFKDNYNWFKKNQWLKFPSLYRRGIRGLGIWGAKMSYKMHGFPIFIKLYKNMVRVLRVDVKF